MKLFSGTSNIGLAEEVAQKLGIKLSASEVVRFDNSEVRVQIEEDVKNETCVVIQSTSNPTDTNLMELIFFCDALKRKEARKIVAVIPCFGYARQNIQHREGECVSVNVVIKLLESIGFDKVYTFDLHDRATEGVFSIPFKHLSAVETLAASLRAILKKGDVTVINPGNIAIVAPDQGAIFMARCFGEFLFETSEFSLAVIEKKRSYRKIHTSTSLGLYGDVKDKVAIIVDDLVTSGGTLVQAVNLCEQNGASSVYAAISHPDLSENAPQRIEESSMKALLVSNTIHFQPHSSFKKIQQQSIADVLVNELKDID